MRRNTGRIPWLSPTTKPMKVLLKTGRATEEHVWKPGEECEITDEAEAKRLIEAGDAEPVAEKRSDRRETRPTPTVVESR